MSTRRRPRHHTYDYNFKVGESSYQDMLDYLDTKDRLRQSSPPGRKTFAERFAKKPFYGNPGPLEYGTASMPERQPYSSLKTDDESPKTGNKEKSPRLRFNLDDELADLDRDRKPRIDIGNDDFLEIKPRPKLDLSSDMDPDEFLDNIRKNRPRIDVSTLDEEDLAGLKPRRRTTAAASPEPGEDLGSMTRRALKQIGSELEGLGLTEKPARGGRSVALRGESEASLKASAASSASYSAKMTSSNVSKMSSTSSTKRSVRYE